MIYSVKLASFCLQNNCILIIVSLYVFIILVYFAAVFKEILVDEHAEQFTTYIRCIDCVFCLTS